MNNGVNHSYQDINRVTGNVDLDDDTLSELHAQLSLYTDQALGYHEGELGVRVRESWEYYYGKLPAPVCNGASSWVDRTVWEAVNGTAQELSNVFTSGEEAVRFRPYNDIDGVAANAATKLVNKILLEENCGFKVLNDAFKECCVARNSFIKVWWKEDKVTKVAKFHDITEQELDMAMSVWPEGQKDDIIAFDIDFDEETGLGNGEISYRVEDNGVCVEFVPFEQVLIEPQSTSLCDTNYLGHRVRKTKDELINMGFDEETVKEMSPASTDIEAGVIANERINNISPMNVSDVVMTGDERADKLWLYENYLKTSVLSGELELVQIFSCHGQILEINRVNAHPFVTMSPFPIPGFVYGESVADITKDIQDLNTFTVRGMIDNIMNANFRRYTAIKGAYDRKSLLDNRPGGVVEIQTLGAVTPFPYHPLPQGMNYLLEYIEARKEQRTGVTRLGQGLNSDVFKNDNAEGMVNTMMSAAQSRLRMVCRNVANTGMKDLMKCIYRLVRENETKPITMMSPAGPVEIDPKKLPPREEMIVSIAVGSSERDERARNLLNLFQLTKGDPNTAEMMQPEQTHFALGEIYKAMGVYDIENYITHPSQVPPKAPSPQDQMLAQKTAEETKLLQAQLAQIQHEIQMAQQKFEFEQTKAADDFTMRKEESLSSQDETADKMALEETKLSLESQKLALERHIAQQTKEIDLAKLELERNKILIEAQLEDRQERAVSIGGDNT